MADLQDERLKKHFATPLSESEKCSGKYFTKDSVTAYFTPREPASTGLPAAAGTAATVTTTTTPMTATMKADTVTSTVGKKLTATHFHNEVTKLVRDSNFVQGTNSVKAPLPMLAFAKIVMEQIINKRGVDAKDYFHGITMTVPPLYQQSMQPEYHSVVGQKLLYADWLSMYEGIQIPCNCCRSGALQNDRTNFSKNKLLFPMFVVDGPPMWCMVQSMTCTKCPNRISANEGNILRSLPAYARNAYPVEPKYALSKKHSHLGKSATTVFDLLMPTYGNGDLCSRLLYNAINRSYLDRVEDYYSFYASNVQKEVPSKYVEQHGYYINAYPPTGDLIRKIYDTACSSDNNP